MATYDHKQVLTDYASGRITPEMAIGHGLQHIDHLYDLLKSSKQEWQSTTDALEKRAQLTQAAVDRLTAIIEKARAKRKPDLPHQSKPDQS